MQTMPEFVLSCRLPTWQVAVLLLLSVALLYLALSWTSPRARAAKSWNSHLPKVHAAERDSSNWPKDWAAVQLLQDSWIIQ